MNSASAFGGRVPGDISGLVESYVPGASSMLPVLYSLAGFNFIGYMWQKTIQAFVSFFLVSVSIPASDSLCGEVLEWLTENVSTRRGLGAVNLNASKVYKEGELHPSFRRYYPWLAYPLLSYDPSSLGYVNIVDVFTDSAHYLKQTQASNMSQRTKVPSGLCEDGG